MDFREGRGQRRTSFTFSSHFSLTAKLPNGGKEREGKSQGPVENSKMSVVLPSYPIICLYDRYKCFKGGGTLVEKGCFVKPFWCGL